jgi:transposase
VRAVKGGETQAAVARVLGVPRSTVTRWVKLDQQPDGLAAKPHPGSARRLSAEQHRQLARLLLEGAKAHGWSTDLWTTARVAALIERHFGTRFHHDHVGRMLHERLNWSPQKPERRARERDEAAIENWRQVRFPAIAEGTRQRDAHLVFLDESGYMLTPTVRRTWAPCGRTPILGGWDRRDRVSAISCLTLSPKAWRLNLYFRLLAHNVHGEDVVAFLKELKAALGGPLTVLWDRSRVHSRCQAAQEYLRAHPEVVAEDLPAYAPELNPDELVWTWTKYGRLANLAANDGDQLAEQVIDELVYLKEHPELLASFVEKTDLPLAA